MRHGRRPLRHRLRSQNRPNLTASTPAAGPPAALNADISPQGTPHHHAHERHPHRHRSRLRVDGWDQLHKRSAQTTSELLAPAIPTRRTVARPRNHRRLLEKCDLRKTPPRRTYLRGRLPSERQPPAVGEVFKNPELAWSLRQVARAGRKCLLQGPHRPAHPR